VELSWNQEALLEQLKAGLSNEMHTGLRYMDFPEDFDGFVRESQKLDNKIRINKARQSSSPARHKKPAPRNTTPAPVLQPKAQWHDPPTLAKGDRTFG
jgi:hypothetical protein